MIRIQFASVHGGPTIPNAGRGTAAFYERVAAATEVLLWALSRLERLAAPKSFAFSGAHLTKCEQIIHPEGSDGRMIRVEGCTPMNEIVQWRIHGTIGKRSASVVADSTFYTHAENRSGNWLQLLNGKSEDKLTLDDICEDEAV